MVRCATVELCCCTQRRSCCATCCAVGAITPPPRVAVTVACESRPSRTRCRPVHTSRATNAAAEQVRRVLSADEVCERRRRCRQERHTRPSAVEEDRALCRRGSGADQTPDASPADTECRRSSRRCRRHRSAGDGERRRARSVASPRELSRCESSARRRRRRSVGAERTSHDGQRVRGFATSSPRRHSSRQENHHAHSRHRHRHNQHRSAAGKGDRSARRPTFLEEAVEYERLIRGYAAASANEERRSGRGSRRHSRRRRSVDTRREEDDLQSTRVGERQDHEQNIRGRSASSPAEDHRESSSTRRRHRRSAGAEHEGDGLRPIWGDESEDRKQDDQSTRDWFDSSPKESRRRRRRRRHRSVGAERDEDSRRSGSDDEHHDNEPSVKGWSAAPPEKDRHDSKRRRRRQSSSSEHEGSNGRPTWGEKRRDDEQDAHAWSAGSAGIDELDDKNSEPKVQGWSAASRRDQQRDPPTAAEAKDASSASDGFFRSRGANAGDANVNAAGADAPARREGPGGWPSAWDSLTKDEDNGYNHASPSSSRRPSSRGRTLPPTRHPSRLPTADRALLSTRHRRGDIERGERARGRDRGDNDGEDALSRADVGAYGCSGLVLGALLGVFLLPLVVVALLRRTTGAGTTHWQGGQRVKAIGVGFFWGVLLQVLTLVVVLVVRQSRR